MEIGWSVRLQRETRSSANALVLAVAFPEPALSERASCVLPPVGLIMKTGTAQPRRNSFGRTRATPTEYTTAERRRPDSPTELHIRGWVFLRTLLSFLHLLFHLKNVDLSRTLARFLTPFSGHSPKMGGMVM